MRQGAPEDIHKRLFWFGYYVGMSFQITDDILDFIHQKTAGEAYEAHTARKYYDADFFVWPLKCDFLINRQLFEREYEQELINEIISDIKSSNAIERSFEDERSLSAKSDEHFRSCRQTRRKSRCIKSQSTLEDGNFNLFTFISCKLLETMLISS